MGLGGSGRRARQNRMILKTSAVKRAATRGRLQVIALRPIDRGSKSLVHPAWLGEVMVIPYRLVRWMLSKRFCISRKKA
jgi:hypothetical protein